MGFLDNSGDIILDAVLTDTGRFRLAKGDGSFRIVKFALADDEIDYTTYNKDHASGSAYFDLEILQTPVLEAFTNNTSLMKSKLLSVPRTDLLYLPVLKLNQLPSTGKHAMHSVGAFIVMVDKNTENDLGTATGLLNGETTSDAGGFIRLDQGLDTTEQTPQIPLSADLVETQYIIEMDNRFGRVMSIGASATAANVSFVDDDNIASYFLSVGTDSQYVRRNPKNLSTDTNQTIAGPRGTIIEFKIGASTELDSSTYLFTKLGSTVTMTSADSGNSCFYYIDTMVRVTGATTGYRLDVPVRFVKLKTADSTC